MRVIKKQKIRNEKHVLQTYPLMVRTETSGYILPCPGLAGREGEP